MQIIAGGTWSNGKMFSVAGKKDSLALAASIPHDATTRPELRVRSRRTVSCLTLCGEIYARTSRVALRPPRERLELQLGSKGGAREEG